MISRIHLSTIIFVVSVLWALLLILDGVAVSISWSRHLSAITGIVVLLITAFDLWLWRWGVLQEWFVNRPDLNGTWRATIKPNKVYVDKKTGKTFETVEGYMAIRQTYSSLSLRLMTDETLSSKSLGSQIVRDPDGTYRVVYSYRNEPKISVQHRSRIHHGAAILHIHGSPPTSLEGHYWTDRASAGTLQLTDHQKKIYPDFETTDRAFNPKSSENIPEKVGV